MRINMLKSLSLVLMSAAAFFACSATGEGAVVNTPTFTVEVMTSFLPDPTTDVSSFISVSPARAAAGTLVTITVKQEVARWLKSLEIEDNNTKMRPESGIISTSTATGSNQSTYTFYMPLSDVSINAIFNDTASNVAHLSSIQSPNGSIMRMDNLGAATSDYFSSANTNYILEVSPLVTKANLAWIPANIGAKTEVIAAAGDDTDLLVEDSHGSINVGAAPNTNVVTFNVIAQDDITSASYNVLVVQKPDLSIDRIKIYQQILTNEVALISEPPIIPDAASSNGDTLIKTTLNRYSNNLENTINVKPVKTLNTTGTVNNIGVHISGAGEYAGTWQHQSPGMKLENFGIIASGSSYGANANSRIILKQSRSFSSALPAPLASWQKVYEQKYRVIIERPDLTNYPVAKIDSAGSITHFIKDAGGVWDEIHIYTVQERMPFTDNLFEFKVGTSACTAKVLLIGGGGGGGKSGSVSHPGSGGGAGGVLYVDNIALAANSEWKVLVGGAGRGGTDFAFPPATLRTSGGDSQLYQKTGSVSYSAKGGGAGGWHKSGNGGIGLSGGSGGGGYGGSNRTNLGGSGEGTGSQGMKGGLHGDYGAGGGGGFKDVGFATYKNYSTATKAVEGRADGGLGFTRIDVTTPQTVIIRDIDFLPAAFSGGGAGGAANHSQSTYNVVSDPVASHGGGAHFESINRGAVSSNPTVKRDANGTMHSGGGGMGGYNGNGYNGGSGVVVLRIRHQ